jgi:type II secretory pathway pseudopilin PulG
MRARLADEAGVTMAELVVVMTVLAIVMGGLADIFVSGLRAGSDASARTAGQGTIQVAVDRLEYELRCASGATVPNGTSPASSVTLSLPTQCTHATGQYTWCVSSGTLTRYAAADCTGSGQIFATGVTTATPFTLLATSGYLPRLQLSLSVDGGQSSSDTVSITDVVTLRNAARS